MIDMIHVDKMEKFLFRMGSKRGEKREREREREQATRFATGLNIHPRSIEEICNFGAFVLHERAGNKLLATSFYAKLSS